jgi:hypothetical protein
MPQKRAIENAKKDARAGKRPSTQAGEFVKEEMDSFKSGKGNIKSRKQAIAVGLSEARRSGVNIPDNPNKKAKAKSKSKIKAKKKMH